MARTARQRAALRKAQLASARKRRGKGKGKLAAANRRARRNRNIAIGTGIVAGVAVGLGGYKSHKSGLNRALKTYGKTAIQVGYYTGKVKIAKAQNKRLTNKYNRQVTKHFKKQLKAL